MAENIRLEVVTPEKSVVSEAAQIVMAPGTLGEFGVLSGHTPFLTTLKTGSLKYKDETGRERFVFLSGGFAEALPDRVTVLAESAERRVDIDIERAKAAAERAEKRMQSGSTDTDFIRAKAALLRAISRIQLAETR
ncbi:ATP synthase epsilon chain [Desulfosarcina cetonica]|uniref:F0F1 ATP synthase subunit epsilon n=1 Tax=Desulfosarcina cetonica TaxID=90730 RepID=UPI0006D24960|nr:F0F1 ATP synthase subunit epsilon [Desulfosarcina cetonica]VTR71340.1 ATP synthase epsilon chain [Desulfosarcina cetonica]